MRKADDIGAGAALLPALRLLLEERNVTRAAQRAGMSQPAMSRALARLRRLFGDALLVRGPAGSSLTARAQALAAELPPVLDEVARLIRPPSFDPATAAQRFTIATVDYVSLVLLPAVLRRVRREAPGLELDVRNVGAADAAEALAAGIFDLVIGAEGDIGGSRGLYRQRLFEDDFACLVPRRLAGKSKTLPLEGYLALPHALVTVTGRGGGRVDLALERLGRVRRVALRVQAFLAAPRLAAAGDLVVTLPRRMAEQAAAPGLAVRDLPLDLGTFAFAQVWHARRHRDHAHAWLRERIATAARALDRPAKVVPARNLPSRGRASQVYSRRAGTGTGAIFRGR
jgi:DNA-binding transcriptional LysR family regulator